jgi:hypothetical protein
MLSTPSLFAGAPILSVYTRAQGLLDGVLVDAYEGALFAVTRAHVAGVTPLPPVALTQSLLGLMKDVEDAGQGDLAGCWHDILSMAGVYGGGGLAAGMGRLFYRAVQTATPKKWRFPVTLGGRTHHLVAEIHEGDVGEPVITLMCPEDE